MISKEDAKKEIKKLIEKYQKIEGDVVLMRNESQVCDSLIRPFFRDVLGWDIEDPYEFKSEYIQGGKRVDYMACIEGVSQFIIEAKAPSREIKDETSFYRQAIQYAEFKGRDFAILTNFKTFIILRAGIETRGPLVNEIRKIDLLNLTEENLEFLLNFERSFWVQKGEENPLYQFNSNLKRKRPLDEVLVEDLSKWRDILKRSLKEGPAKEYNFDNVQEMDSVEEEIQRFIDRLIFICYCEDKQLNDNQLKSFLNEERDKHLDKKNVIVGKMKKVFESYNKIYDSDLFKEGLCDKFEFDDLALKKVIEGLRGYYEGLPYDFSIIDADILGAAYEGFLGHITTGKLRFKEKEDIGKRKKMGIYYTPQYIVNYIIKNTVRERVKGLSFDEILKIKIIDPACGSGSFLIKAFDVLVEESKIKLKRDLNYEEKEKLMLNCIWGVDLDERACDIVKLNLSLKLAQRNKKLPQLHKNIQNGNSLIEDPQLAGDKALNWLVQFPEVFQNGGFDIVIGNPPYAAKLEEEHIIFFKKKWRLLKGTLDTYILFLMKSSEILKRGGYLGFIIPQFFLTNSSSKDFRYYLLKNLDIVKIVDYTKVKVFQDATKETIIFILKNDLPNKKNDEIEIITELKNKDLPNNQKNDTYRISQEKLINDDNGNRINLNFNEKIRIFISKMKENSKPLKEYVKMMDQGIKTGDDARFLNKKRNGPSYKSAVNGKNVKRYYLEKDAVYVLYDKDRLAEPKDEKLFLTDEKILMQYIRNLSLKWRLLGAIDRDQIYPLRNVKTLFSKDPKVSLTYLLALINSKLLNYYYSICYVDIAIKKNYLEEIPIKFKDKEQELKISSLVEKITGLKKKFYEVHLTENEKTKIEQQIKDIDDQINQEVYKLYNLSGDEIKIIETYFEDDKP